jgi:hypothetical protein
VAPGNSLVAYLERRDRQLEDVTRRNHERGLMLARSGA